MSFRGVAVPSLLAMIAVEKFGQHQPLNLQAECDALENHSGRARPASSPPRPGQRLYGVTRARPAIEMPVHTSRHRKVPGWHAGELV